MEVRAASQATPGSPANQDYFFAGPDLVGVLDGVSVPHDLGTGCIHGTTWYVRSLSAAILAVACAEPEATLSAVLATAIRQVTESHRDTCDLEHPGTPASTICLLRTRSDLVDYLVLCDSPLVFDDGFQVTVITDMRFETTIAPLRAAALTGVGAIGSGDHQARIKSLVTAQRKRVNRPDGYWVAAADPRAAAHARVGQLPLTGSKAIRRAALLTDGAACAVDQYELFTWRQALDVLGDEGPRHLIEQVRVAEQKDVDGLDWPRYKRHDDATVAFCTFSR
jgi:hypothetical protein